MAKTNKLKVIPHNLAQSYFSSLSYYKDGYMEDWVWRVMKNKGVNNIKIDILNRKVFPSTKYDQALICYLPKLQNIIKRTLVNNSFDEVFIVKAELNFELFEGNGIKCYSTMEDRNGKKYYSKKPICGILCYGERDKETCQLSIFQKIKLWLKNLN